VFVSCSIALTDELYLTLRRVGAMATDRSVLFKNVQGVKQSVEKSQRA